MKVKDLFQKELHELTAADLKTYFQDPLEESDVIEYKSFGGKEYENEKESEKGKQSKRERKILSTICSFLNSSGGVLIWGAPEEIKVDNVNVLQKELSPIDHVIKKDHFIAKILNRIIPSPIGVRCGVVLVEEDKCVLVFEVEESKNRPHQFENIYYMRADGQTSKAPHHYVEALFKQVRYPTLEGYLFLKQEGLKFHTNEEGMGFIDVPVEVDIYNESPFINERNLCVSILVVRTAHKMENQVFPVLHHGSPISISTTLRFPIWMSRKIRVDLLFGGELSPLCSSRYLIECGLANTYDGVSGKVIERRPWVKEIKSELNKFYFETEGPLLEEE